jgi:serine protease Do
MMKRFVWLIPVLALAVVVVLSGALGDASASLASAPEVLGVGASEEAGAATTSGEVLAAIEERMEAIYDQVSPSVVNIQVVQQAELPFGGSPDFFFSPPSDGEPQEFYQQGAGSGFVWDKEGHIVTNNHVVADAERIRVTFQDGSTVAGEIVGTDPDSDLAVLKVDVAADRLTPVEMADSDLVKVGELTVAIGNPFGLEGTMTVGFVSALGRLLPVTPETSGGPGYSIPDVIQTDAPINPGNSGGVLVDDQGRVIGVTSAIISPVGTSAGIGFAIPSTTVAKVVPVLIDSGAYEHPWLGVSGASLNPDIAEAMNLEADQRGALVMDVVPDGPADRAGLRGSDRQVEIDGQEVRVGGDVILAIDDQPVHEFDDLIAYLARATEVGQVVSLTVLRDGGEQVLDVSLAPRPGSDTGQERADRDAAGGAWLGIRGRTMTPVVAEAMDLPEDQTGILIEEVEVGSPADQAGLRGSYKPAIVDGERLPVGGDVITALDKEPVDQMENLQTLIRQAEPGQEVTLTVLRDGKELEVPVTLTESPGATD